MKPYYSDDAVTLYAGDCRDVLAELPDASIDAICTDPPYELAFMGRAWDASGIAYDAGMWRECLRVLKPGGHLLAFGGTRTYHRMTCAIEDAGFEVRDSIHWIYGSGFPKSLDVGKAIDKAAGATREVVGREQKKPFGYGDSPWKHTADADVVLHTAPATADAARWDGWATALKPSHEPVVVARKPLAGTVAATILAFGTGALNIGACRIGDAVMQVQRSTGEVVSANGSMSGPNTAREVVGTATGRWPANAVLAHQPLLDDAGNVIGDACTDGCVPGCPIADMDAQSGITGSRQRTGRRTGKSCGTFGAFAGQEVVSMGHNDTGGASRYFPVFRYQAKAPASERPRGEDGTTHPTVKPLALMRWLVRLVTPPKVFLLKCPECEKELHGVRESVQTKATGAGSLLDQVPSTNRGAIPEECADALPDMRESSSRRASPQVLQHGVRSARPTQAEDLQDLRSGLSGASSDPDDMLASVRRQSHGPSSQAVRDMPSRVPTQVQKVSFLLPGLLCESDGVGEAQAVPGDVERVPAAAPAGPSDVEQAGLRARASQGDGGSSGTEPLADGGGTSPERDQGRQQDREPRGSAEVGARQASKATAEANRVPSLPRDDRRLGACPDCGAALVESERPGVVLDPFLGSGTTAEACAIEGFRCVGVELDEAHLQLTKVRLARSIQPTLGDIA